MGVSVVVLAVGIIVGVAVTSVGSDVVGLTVGVVVGAAVVVVGSDVVGPTVGIVVGVTVVVVVGSVVVGPTVGIVVGAVVVVVGSDVTGLAVGVAVSAKKDPVSWIPRLVHSGGNVVAGHCTKTRPGQDLSVNAGHENEFGGRIPAGHDGGAATVSTGGKSCQFASSVMLTAAY